ncbi:hypothetical protein NPIL_430191, partial [Nephila pilipes]
MFFRSFFRHSSRFRWWNSFKEEKNGKTLLQNSSIFVRKGSKHL